MTKLPAVIAATVFLVAGSTSASSDSTSFRDCSNCPDMVRVPGGSFLMGSPHSVTQAENVPPKRTQRERPVHRVRITTFALAKHEVTRQQYAAFVMATGYRKAGGCKYWTGSKFEIATDKGWHNPGYPQQDNHPAVCISWDDAKAYVAWLANRTGKPYRLPSEAEWEYSARGHAGTPRFWGTDPAAACTYANVFDLKAAEAGAFPSMTPHNCNDGFSHTAPVGSFPANAFGLHDTAGNVWEWTEDCWHKSYDGAPEDGSTWVADGRCTQRVLRGGSWISLARFVRSGNRSKMNSDIRIYRNGFRVARDLTR